MKRPALAKAGLKGETGKADILNPFQGVSGKLAGRARVASPAFLASSRKRFGFRIDLRAGGDRGLDLFRRAAGAKERADSADALSVVKQGALVAKQGAPIERRGAAFRTNDHFGFPFQGVERALA